MLWKTTPTKLLLLCLLVAACSSNEKKPQIDPSLKAARDREVKMAAAFEQASIMLDDGYFDKAAKRLDALRVEKPVSTLDGMILYNSGIAHYKSGNCEASKERFREALRFAKAKKVKGLAVRSKLRLTEVYSCLGDRKNTLITLLEVYRERLSLPPEIGEAEVPARIASAYAQNGNRRMANRFFKKAERGLQLVERRHQNTRAFKSHMAKTLFMMGNMSSVHPDGMESRAYFNAVKSLQKYLYRAVQAEQSPWSNQASEQIISAYEKTWAFVDRSEEKSEELTKIEYRKNRKARAEIVKNAIQALSALRREVIPESKDKKSVNNLFLVLNREERKMRNYLATSAPGTELRPEAQKLIGKKREGKVKSRETVLERKARQRLPQKRKQ